MPGAPGRHSRGRGGAAPSVRERVDRAREGALFEHAGGVREQRQWNRHLVWSTVSSSRLRISNRWMAQSWARLDTCLRSLSFLAQTPVALLSLAPCKGEESHMHEGARERRATCMQDGVLFSSHPNGHSAKGTAESTFQYLVRDDVCRRLTGFRAARA